MDPKAIRTLEAWDKKYVWHPFTQEKEWRESPITIIEKGQGNSLVDVRGRRYLDGVSSLWCNVHGHRVKEIDAAIQKQLRRIAHSTFLGLSHPPAILLAKRLVEITPKGLSKVFYSDSGSASVEVALKMAYQYWKQKGSPKKNTFLKLKNAYHGDTLGSVSVGGIGLFHEIFYPLLFKTFEADAPYFYRDSFEGDFAGYAAPCLKRVEIILKKHHERIAALIVEPLIQGAAGMLNQPPGYLKGLRRLTEKYKTLLIADEVATGFGRTGKMFACEHENVTPDFLCVAKGISGGVLPLSATLTTQEVFGAFLGNYAEFKAFFHGHTYSANPLACAAAMASLDLFEKNDVLKKMCPKIQFLNRALSEMKNLEHVGDVRQVGLMAGLELVQDKLSKTPYPLAEKRGFRVAASARRRGLMLRPLGNVVVLMPPLSIASKELQFLCRVVQESVREATAS